MVHGSLHQEIQTLTLAYMWAATSAIIKNLLKFIRILWHWWINFPVSIDFIDRFCLSSSCFLATPFPTPVRCYFLKPLFTFFQLIGFQLSPINVGQLITAFYFLHLRNCNCNFSSVFFLFSLTCRSFEFSVLHFLCVVFPFFSGKEIG